MAEQSSQAGAQPALNAAPALSPQQALARLAVQLAEIGGARLQYRSAGDGAQVTHVLLHGIGSGSASWAYQLHAALGSSRLRVLAWDAPGYGRSTPLAAASPQAGDYAERLWAWLDAVGATQPLVLVGHSLGALMAAAAARLRPARVRRLVLLAPARGYGDADPAEREAKLLQRLHTLQQLGPQGMAAARAAAMLSPAASSDLLAAVRQTMAEIDPAGYAQAARMLAGGRLIDDLVALDCPISIASGEADTITPPAGCSLAARSIGQPWINLGATGHACPLEAAGAVNTLLGLN